VIAPDSFAGGILLAARPFTPRGIQLLFGCAAALTGSVESSIFYDELGQAVWAPNQLYKGT